MPHLKDLKGRKCQAEVVERCKKIKKCPVLSALLRIAAHRACCEFQTGSLAKEKLVHVIQ